MKSAEHSHQEFIGAMQTAEDQVAFERIARRITERLGFRWFAYLRLSDDVPSLMSSYPKSWTDRYFNPGYRQIDPVVRRARGESGFFTWAGDAPRATGTREQRKFFDEAMTFGIKSGVTVSIKSGFGFGWRLCCTDRISAGARLSEPLDELARVSKIRLSKIDTFGSAPAAP